MKKKSFLLALLLFSHSQILSNCCSCTDCSDDHYTSQSFMFTRPIAQAMVGKHFGWHNLIHDRHGDMLSAVQFIAMYQQSMYHEETAQYFLIGGKNCLKVAGDNAPDVSHITNSTQTTQAILRERAISKIRDIRAEWIGLPDNFSGSLTLNPKQQQTGFYIEYNQRLSKFFDYSFFDQMWISISAPIVSVENTLGFKQFDVQNRSTGEGPNDILEAFAQKDWCYGKITNKHSELQLANLRLMIGSTYMSENNFQIAYYSHYTFSTADSDPAHYMFDAVADNNGHIGLGAGVNFQVVLTREESAYDGCLFVDLEHTFLIRKHHMRTVDLIGKPWSRYLTLTRKDKGADYTVPGINVLTREFKVRPYSMIDFAFGTRIKRGKIELEVGYNLWGRGDEKLDELICPFPEIYGIKGIKQDGDTEPRTASLSTIGKLEATADEDAAADSTGAGFPFIPIKLEDLNFKSGAARSVLNHKIHAALSLTHKGKKVDGTFGFGAFYEIAQRNSSLKQWGMWGKVATTF